MFSNGKKETQRMVGGLIIHVSGAGEWCSRENC
jgi:hypothetical protein